MRVEFREPFCVIGRLGQGPARFWQIWIRPLWRDLNEELDAIIHLVKRTADGEIAGTWGLMSDAAHYLQPWGSEGRYLAGCEVNPGSSPPKGWTLWNVPAQTYLIVTCARSDYRQNYHQVLSDLASSRKYRLAGAVHEHYPPDAADQVELFVPVGYAAEQIAPPI